jgi:acyl dehydratase
MGLQQLLPGYTGLLWNAPTLGRVLVASAWISARGAPLPQPAAAAAVPTRRSGSRPDRRADLATYLALTDAGDLVRPQDSLPPLYFLTWSLAPHVELITSPGLSLSLFGILHVQNDLIVHRAPGHADRVVSEVSVERITSDADRALVSIRCASSVAGALVTEMRTLLFAGASASGPAAPPEPRRDFAADASWDTLRTIPFAADLGWRYACLTGDVNPIHLSPLTSRLFGLRRPIAHGFCVKAVIAHALVRALGGGRFDALRRLRLRFRAPVPLPSVALCQIRNQDVRLLDREQGTIYATGRFRVQSSPVP